MEELTYNKILDKEYNEISKYKDLELVSGKIWDFETNALTVIVVATGMIM